MNRTTKRIGALGTATVAVVGTGVAFAAWTSSGSGQGSAIADTAHNVTFAAATASNTTKLFPGGTGDIVVSVDNPNGYNASLTNFQLNHVYDASTWTAQTPGTDIKGTCFLTLTGTPTVVVAPGTHSYLLASNINMGADADQTACAGTSFVLDLSSDVASTTATAATPAS